MIMTLRTTDYAGLRTAIPDDAKVLIWGCNTCARSCGGLGGREAVASLAASLRTDGVEVVGGETLTASCFVSALRKRLTRADYKEMISQATHVIPLTCKTGTMVLLEEMPHLKVVDVSTTVGLGYLSESRGAVLTDPMIDGIEVPEEGVALSEAAEILGLQYGPFCRE